MYTLQVYGLMIMLTLIAAFVIGLTVLLIMIARDYIRSRQTIRRMVSSIYLRNNGSRATDCNGVSDVQ